MSESPVAAVSPRQWTKPADVMRARQRVTRSLPAEVCQQLNDSLEEKSDVRSVRKKSTAAVPQRSKKRCNPFGSSPCSAVSWNHSAVSGLPQLTSSPQLLKVLDDAALSSCELGAKSPYGSSTLTRAACGESTPPELSTADDSMLLDAAQANKTSTASVAGKRPLPNCGKTPPVDWTPKMRARLISKTAFACCALPRTADEAQALHGFASGYKSCQNPMVKLQESLLYWTFPHLPGVNLYPRIAPDNKISSSFCLTDSMKTSLHDQWSESFASVYGQTKCGFVPYFYLLTSVFTVLFRSGAVTAAATGTSIDSMAAVITPTTLGLRRALRAEGVDFSTMPRQHVRQGATVTDGRPRRDTVTNHCIMDLQDAQNEAATGPLSVDEDNDGDDATPDGWLASIGLDKESFPSLRESQVLLQKDGFRGIDGRPESTVFVSGQSVQILFNFLLNYSGCFATTGIQAGVPPSIVALQPFLGANLQKMKLRCVQLQDVDNARSGAQPTPSSGKWVLEVKGPILPHTQRALYDLAESQGECYALLSVLPGTEPFNVVPPGGVVTERLQWPSDEGTANSKDSASSASYSRVTSGLCPDPTNLQAGSGDTCMTTLKELSYNANSWHWT